MHLFFLKVQTGSGAQLGSCSMDIGGFSLGVKRPGREAGHSLTYSMELKNGWNSISFYPSDFIIVTINSGRI